MRRFAYSLALYFASQTFTAMAIFSISLVMASLILPGLQALEFERRPGDDLLDKWLQEQMAETQSSQGIPTGFASFGTSDLGYATPGHVEEHDYMTAFFDNQDHDAFADGAEDHGYNADAAIDEYLTDFFGYSETQTADKDEESDTQSSPWMAQEPAVNQDKDDSDMESFIEDYFRSEQAKKTADKDAKDEESDTVPQSAPWMAQEPAVNQDKDDSDVDYFRSEQAKKTESYAKIEEEDEADSYQANAAGNTDGNNIFENFFGSNPVEEGHSQNKQENDLELWFQTMSEPEEEVEEEEETLIKSDFANNFPDDDMFLRASVQDIEMMDPECGQWKNSIVAVQAKVKTLGLKLQKKIEALQAALTEYREQLSIPCERNCEMVCMPVSAGEECLEKVNGTCVLFEPIIDDCGQKQRDPTCEAMEDECRSNMKPYADKVRQLEQEKQECKDELDIVVLDLAQTMEAFPPQCAEEHSPTQ